MLHTSLDLTQFSEGGVYFVAQHDFDAFGASAAAANLDVRRLDLSHCRDKSELLKRVAKAFSLPAEFGQNWDALLDSLRDNAAADSAGVALMLDHANDFRRAATSDFETLVGILSDAAQFALERQRPFFAFFNLPENVIKHSSRI